MFWFLTFRPPLASWIKATTVAISYLRRVFLLRKININWTLFLHLTEKNNIKQFYLQSPFIRKIYFKSYKKIYFFKRLTQSNSIHNKRIISNTVLVWFFIKKEGSKYFLERTKVSSKNNFCPFSKRILKCMESIFLKLLKYNFLTLSLTSFLTTKYYDWHSK